MLLECYPKPKRKVLTGRYCKLVPFDSGKHASELYKAFQLDLDNRGWLYMPYGPFQSESEFLIWVSKTCLGWEPLFFTVCTRENSDPVGLISLLNIVPQHGKIEIGHVRFSSLMQRTRASTEANYLLMKYVFDELGYRRLEWRCHHGNEKSKNCAKRLGFSFEGLLRQHWVMKGKNRDTAGFSMIDKEWRSIQSKIESWLLPDNFSADGTQLRHLNIQN
jgi:RimJ/RimL family protein N-acetyltransferase